MAAARSRQPHVTPRQGEDLALLEIARARGVDLDDTTTLPPGRRDDSGFWFPAAYREPRELFTPQERSLQAKQRLVQRRRHRSATAPAALQEGTVPLPAPLTDALPGMGVAARSPHARRDGSGHERVDSPGRSV